MTKTNFDPFDRNSNLEIIRQIRNSEKISLDDYIDKVLIPLKEENPNFLNTLYKDIVYVLDGLDNDLLFENGELVIEDGDFKLTGYQTRLHDIGNWLHQEFVRKTMENIDVGFESISDKLENAELQLLKNDTLTIEYKLELNKIKKSIEKEKKHNHDNKSNGLKKYLDFDILELKPNIFGLGINFNEIINKAKNKE
tara:strand:+ start:26 stop:613 length:588 start_codon:yes stop_codon:yes gene_type:complete